jgi:DNA helicase II / ATP-dependent DNA helicase PcrA
MAKRNFKLPGIGDLNKDQEDARALSMDGQHLIIGGPGTGKSVLALLRCRRLHRENEDYVFLVFNHLLNQASNQLFEGKLKSQQWQAWFMSQFIALTNEDDVPKMPAKNGWEEIDWDAVLTTIYELEELPEKDFPSLVIDEGQDMPPQFYQALINLGFKNFFVVADQNQQIKPDLNSTRQDIQRVLVIDANDVIELRRNYRNQYLIAKLAQEFYTGDPASPPPDLPKPETSVDGPMLIEYKASKFKNVIQRILKTADRNPEWLIGIIAPNNLVRERYVKALNEVEVKLDNERSSIKTYSTNNKSNVSFDEGGIVVINAQACKGLEFDLEFLADINEYKLWNSISDQQKKLFYVMVARARRRIIMLMEAGKACQIEKIFPSDPKKLLRKMLDGEQSSREGMKDLIKPEIDGVKEGEAKATQAHKDAEDQVRSGSEKSMEYMETLVKGFRSVASEGGKAENNESEIKKSAAKKLDCVNPDCDKPIDESARFCVECGTQQDRVLD